MNLAATVPGWTRFGVAQDMLDRLEKQNGTEAQQQIDFDAYLKTQSHLPETDAERQALFKNFLQWRDQQQAHAAQKN